MSMCHWALALVIVIPLMFTVHREVSLVKHTVYAYITANRVVTSEFDDSLLPLHLTHVPISQFSTLDGALRGLVVSTMLARHSNLNQPNLLQDILTHFTAMSRPRKGFCVWFKLTHLLLVHITSPSLQQDPILQPRAGFAFWRKLENIFIATR
ncbi:hypothetical protein DFJ58DRAFT_848136 [Suillus subalutaceus]|uniref:uncharacterized protein n=1 Tax=Suillus subalutaceus TaxID=48586 RepID=UPI001B8670A6|nr:uncharacterized protein DFJ58DRAFT_848136 [Suillus subalutaceus]KAG1831902.1 hypothetical protein DFJ58DRAFT_848136 [Suillus subalutaceus]